MAISEKAAPKSARTEKAADDKLADKVDDALDPATGGGVQDVVQVPSVDKTGNPDQTPGHVVLDPEAAAAADQARKESAVPRSVETPESAA